MASSKTMKINVVQQGLPEASIDVKKPEKGWNWSHKLLPSGHVQQTAAKQPPEKK